MYAIQNVARVLGFAIVMALQPPGSEHSGSGRWQKIALHTFRPGALGFWSDSPSESAGDNLWRQVKVVTEEGNT